MFMSRSGSLSLIEENSYKEAMMAEYDNRNTFALFRNNRKEKDTHADFRGTFIDADGREYYLDAWSKTPKNGGEKFLSGRVKLKEDKGSAPAPRKVAAATLDDEVPFFPEFR
jgi:uncharacterized protein (DUF736 family)